MPRAKKPPVSTPPPAGAMEFVFNIDPGGDGVLKLNESKRGADGNAFIETKAIANFTPILKSRRYIHDGHETREELVYVAFRAGKYSKEITLTKADITGIRPDVKFPSDCRVYPGKGNRELFIEFMLAQCERIEPTDVYTHTGVINDGGKLIFLNGELSITAEGQTDKYNVQLPEDLASYKFLKILDPEQDIVNTLLVLYPTAIPAPLYYTMIATAFISPLMPILREIGHVPRFVVANIGKTGVFKTTVNNLNLNFVGCFSYNDRAPLSFDDTENTVGYKLSLLWDVPASLDDRIPGGTAADKKKMSQIEQAAARLIGDRRARGRMTSDIKLRSSYFAKCNLTTTGEEMFTDITESGVARYISLELKPGDIEISKIVEVQNRAHHLNNAMSLYIQWVLQNYDSIKSRAKDIFIGYRNDAQRGEYYRLAEATAHLQLAISFFTEWLVSVEHMTPEQADKTKAKAWAIFTNLAAKQERRIADENPVTMFLESVNEMLARKVIKVPNLIPLDGKPAYNGQSGIGEKPTGYRDADYFYFHPDAIYSAIRAHYATQDKLFPLSKTTLFKRLLDEGLITPGPKQTSKSKRIPGANNAIPLLWLKASALNEEGVEENA